MNKVCTIVFSLLFACGGMVNDPPLTLVAPPTSKPTPTPVMKVITSSSPSYITYGVSLPPDTLEGKAHRLQISAVGEPFDHQIAPDEFHFYTIVGSDYIDTPYMKFSGCNTRNSDSLLCDIDVYPSASVGVYDMCFRSSTIKYIADPRYKYGPGGASTDLCLRNGIFLEAR